MRSRALRRPTLALALCALLPACAGESEPDVDAAPSGERTTSRMTSTSPGTIPDAAASHLEAGNAAYRVGDYEIARDHYREAADADPSVAAAWFGIYMAERALGNYEAADSALARSRLPQERGILTSPPPPPPDR